jgi:hypothetical protein
VKRNEAVIDYALDYGLPGKKGYTYTRPFDYFSFQTSASSAIGFESVLTHGLVLGKDFSVGGDYNALWGLYGSYDHMAPQVFRLSSTAASLGTTAEWRVSPSIALRGTGIVGIGYATVSTINGAVDEHANHYGVAPQALASLRVIFGERASLDLIAREYFVSKVSGGSRGGHDNVIRSEAAFTWRVHREHGIAVKYQLSRRDATFPDLGDFVQTRGTIGLFYTYLGRDRFAIGD